MKGIVFDVEFLWGFQARVSGMSKSSPSFLFPPPTTVLGAIAEAYARRRGFSEGRTLTLYELAKNTLALSYKPLNMIALQFQDINRIISIRTSSEKKITYPSTKDPYGSFDAPARGKTIVSTIDDNPPRMRIFVVFNDEANVFSDDIWKIKRIGSKESMVSVIEVLEGSPDIIVNDTVKTDYMLPLTPELENNIIDIEGGIITLDFVPVSSLRPGDTPGKLYLESQTLKHIIPLPIPKKGVITIKVPQGYVGYRLYNEVVIGFKR